MCDPVPQCGVMTVSEAHDGSPPVVVVGASAGGVEAIRDLVSMLPRGLGACVLIVLHLPAGSSSALPAILRRAGELPVAQAEDGAPLRAGEVLVARPDHHLVVIDGSAALSHGPRENGHRPAVDVLFRSAARARGSDVLGVVLSGVLDDGAAGAVSIARAGGRVVVQAFDQALYSSMPRAAAAAVGDVEQLDIAAIARHVVSWSEERRDGTAGPHQNSELEKEVEMATLDPDAMHDPERPGRPSGFGCPDCAGALFQIEEGNLVRYRCRVGHAWSAESLLARQTVELEGALWMALRSLEEKAALSVDLGERAEGLGHGQTASRFREAAQDVLGAAELVRQLISQIGEAVDAGHDGDEAVGS